jgi:hypothetical protein
MNRAPPVTPVQWLAVLAVWSLVAYGALAAPRMEGKAEARRDQVHLIACR